MDKPSKKKRILLVDDEPAVLGICGRMLERIGQSAETAGNVEDALALIRKASFDLLIEDVMLPDGSGLTVAAEFRKLYPKNPIIVITGSPHADSREESKKLGATAYLVKPFEPGLFVETVEKALKSSI